MKAFLTSLLVGATLAILSGCASYYHEDEAAYSTRPIEYYYYPETQVYYDPVRRIYFWRRDGGWESGTALPAVIVVDPRNRVTVRLDTTRPYLRHEVIRTRYPAVVSRETLPAPRYTFLYYPHHAVYLDPVRHRYYWYENDRWEQHERPPHALVSNPESPVSVELDTPTPERPPDRSPAD